MSPLSLLSRIVLAAMLAWPAGAIAQAAPDHAPDAGSGRGASGAPPSDGSGGRGRPERTGAADRTELRGGRLPPDVTTHHVLQLPGRTLTFTARAGSLPLVDPDGNVQAEIGYVAYTLDGARPATRPVTFALNGGPGAASAYLHLGPVGPWRLPVGETAISPSQASALVPNAETWLDFTDLVFVDPIDTGYSRANGSREEIRDRYFTVDGDASSLSAAIARWLRTNDRLGSPKFYLGESYGGFRGPLIAHKLQTDIGIGLSGLVLLSPVLDFGLIGQPRHNPSEYVIRLPSFAAAMRERAGPVSRVDLEASERYAAGDYLVDLTKGLQDRDAVERASARVVELTGLDAALVRRNSGRIDLDTFVHEFRRGDGRIVSLYDAGVTGFDPDPTGSGGEGDPVLTALTAPLTSAIVEHLSGTLGWRVTNQRYELLNGQVNAQWRYGRSRRAPQAVDELKAAMALDPKLRVMVAHGLTDLVTPYFASELLLRQIPSYGTDRRIALATYPGGHMFYTREASRSLFRADAQRFFDGAVRARVGE